MKPILICLIVSVLIVGALILTEFPRPWTLTAARSVHLVVPFHVWTETLNETYSDGVRAGRASCPPTGLEIKPGRDV